MRVKWSNKFKPIKQAGTAFANQAATKKGYTSNSKLWSNLGQGTPELTEIDGDFQRLQKLDLSPQNVSYTPVAGLKGLREIVAKFYNQRYRQNKTSKYSFKNVLIVGGGRSALSRIFSTVGNCTVGSVSPDYTSYEGLLDLFSDFTNKVLNLDPKNNFALQSQTILDFVKKSEIDLFLFSNPCNPTGRTVFGSDLQDLIQGFKELGVTAIFDEFYSNFQYFDGDLTSSSASQYVSDVNQDEVLIIDGLTKGWRYPGFRLSWILGPEDLIENLSRASSFLEGGPNHPCQVLALDLIKKTLDFDFAAQRKHFQKKRDLILQTLKDIGLGLDYKPEGALYVWVDISKLPKPYNLASNFFEKALEYGLIIVPGYFFDVQPKQGSKAKKFQNYIRLSYGPSLETVQRGMQKLRTMVKDFQKN